MKLNRFMVILSACMGYEQDERRMERLKKDIGTTPFDEVRGCYKGVQEEALLVQCHDFSDVGELLKLGQKYDQESIMVIDARGKAFLIYCGTSHTEHLGSLFKYNGGATLPDSYTVWDGEMYYTI